MKKHLGIESLRSHEVPVELDVRIKAEAAFFLRRRQTLRRRKQFLTAAAAAACMTVGVTAFWTLHAPQNRALDKHNPAASQTEFLALADTSRLEQEIFVADQTITAISSLTSEDNYI